MRRSHNEKRRELREMKCESGTPDERTLQDSSDFESGKIYDIHILKLNKHRNKAVGE